MKQCPHPEKRAYGTEEAAEHAAAALTALFVAQMFPYSCRCGSWHLSTQRPKRKNRPTASLPQAKKAAKRRRWRINRKRRDRGEEAA